MRNENNSLVSIIVPVYNREKLLPRALQSLVSQTYKDIEIIVVDDGSSEDIKGVVARFNDTRIRYIRHNENRGVASARNTGLKIAKGDFIAFLDSDDEYLPQKIERQVRCFEDNKDAGLVYCQVLKEEQGEYSICSSHKINILQQILVKREIIEKVGLFDVNFRIADDTDYLLRLRKICRFVELDEPLIIYHWTEGSISKNPQILNRDLEVFIKKHSDVLSRKEKNRRFYSMGKRYQRMNKPSEAMRSFFRAYITYPLNGSALKKMIKLSPVLLFYILKGRK